MIGVSLLVLQAVGALAPDQTHDIVLAGPFLEALRSDDQSTVMKVGPEATITAYESSDRLTSRSFREATKMCRLNSLSVSDNMASQVGVTWYCLPPIHRLYGDIWVKNDTVQRVAFGRQPMITATPFTPSGTR